MKRLLTAMALLGATATAASAQDVLTIASNPQGSQFFTASAAIAKAIDEKLKRQIRVQPMAGSSTYIPLLNRNEVNFGLTNVDDATTSFKGTGNYDGKPNPKLRLTTNVFPLFLSFLVVADSPVKKTVDVKGLRLPSGYAAQSTGRVIQDALLANGGLTMSDVKPVPVVNLFAGTDALGAGRVDVATINPGVGQVQQAHANMAARGGVRFISINTDDESVKRMKAAMPTRPFLVQPAAHRAAVVGPTWFMAYSIFLSTNDQTPDQLVYDVVKMMHDSKDYLVGISPIFGDFDPKAMSEEIGVPWHPGAIKFLTETGQWPPKG
ncbi:MAG: TAXI family TRAP transporter solute-binding subunit [Rhodospirillaceae bacterium]